MKKSDNIAIMNTIAVFLTVMVVIIVWKLILPSYVDNKKQYSNLDTEIIAAENKKASLDKVKTDLSQIDSAYKAITVSISDGSDEPNLISELEAIALKNGLALPSISISADSASSATPVESDGTTIAEALPATPVNISISVSGTFDQLNGLISSLEKSVKFMNIKAANFSQGEDNIALSLQIEAYSRTSTSSAGEGSVNGVSSVSRSAL